MIFWDTSALAKSHLSGERDHERATSLIRGGPRHGGVVLLRTEATSAIVRRLGADRSRRDAALALMESQLESFDLLAVDEPLLDRAVALIRRHALRSADAIHLAGAMQLVREVARIPLRFVTADAAQARAARAEGVRVIELRL